MEAGRRKGEWSPPRVLFPSILGLALFAMGFAWLTSGIWVTDPPPGVGTPSDPMEGATPEDLEVVIGDFLRRQRAPGLAVCLLRPNQPPVVRGFGIADRGSGRGVTEHTIFHMASVSKVFVATAILQLVEDGLLQLDAPVASLLPSFRLADPRGRGITVRQLLSHTSGLPDVKDYHWGEEEWDDGALQRYVGGLSGVKLLSSPGEAFAYSNMGYDILGALISQLSGESFESFMEDRVFQPLGMTESTFRFDGYEAQQLAAPHGGRFDVAVLPLYPYNPAHAPSSTLHSSATDMCHWLSASLAAGVGEGPRILTEESYRAMWTPQAEIRAGRQQGLGWALAESTLGRWVSHGGRDPGFRADITLLPEVGVGIALMANHHDAPLGELRNELLSSHLSGVRRRDQ